MRGSGGWVGGPCAGRTALRGHHPGDRCGCENVKRDKAKAYTSWLLGRRHSSPHSVCFDVILVSQKGSVFICSSYPWSVPDDYQEW